MEQGLALGRIKMERPSKLIDRSSIGRLTQATLQVADGTHANSGALRQFLLR
jgi:hypothetical protein